MPYAPVETALMVMHGLFGTIVVISGAIAMASAKGGRPHRVGGRIFSLALCVMVLVILATALLAPRLVSSLGMIYTVFACYLALTSWATVRTPPRTLDPVTRGAPVLGATIGSAALITGGMAAMGHFLPDEDIPVAAYFVFGLLAWLAAWGDFKIIRKGGAHGTSRLVRHIWRMGLVLYLSTSTLFTGPGSVVFPQGIRGSAVLMLPELTVLVLSVYWIVQIMRGQLRSAGLGTSV